MLKIKYNYISFLSRHAAVVISGAAMARQLHREIQRDVEELVAQGNMRPHLGVVFVGDDPASRTYVRNKTRAASTLGQMSHFSKHCMTNVTYNTEMKSHTAAGMLGHDR